ncbi:MAG: CusA/CzcA family heavy metal efflux RND transporter [Bryobacterales bacterium]|nr:CusA/CzcA family heavy metal efflux RND transporter [Bryobacteraceae bacterium]MDW8352994.1 CusA/CzcA family heavy metal efflux RND transporter [Bryobacterales bacterium]
MRGLLRFALEQRFFTLVGALVLVGAGIWSFSQLQIEAYPDISDPGVDVITLAPGLAAEEVEQQVTIPIERALNNTPGVIHRRSRTIFGLSLVQLTFEHDMDLYRARQMVLERLREVELPEGLQPALGPMATPIGEMFRYTIEAPHLDEMQMRELQDWVIAPRLLQVAGVADVVPFGGLVKQYQIQVDPLRLETYRLTLADIAEAVAAANRNAGGALLDSGQQSMAVRGVGLLRSVADIENSVVSEARGVPIYVKDLGRVTVGPAPRTGIFGLNERTGGVEGIVLMRRGENPSEVLRRVHEAIEELERTRLPAGVRIRTIYDRTELVGNTLRTVSRTLVEGLVVVTLVLLFFLGSARAAVLTGLTIPLSLLFAFTAMRVAGVPANLLSLGAIDFGIIVDGSLVMVEHILHRLKERQGTVDAHLAIRDAAFEMESPIFFSMLIIIAAYLPLFTLERVERRLFTPMAFTVCMALLGALVISMTLVPALATLLFRHGGGGWDNPFITRLAVWYRRTLEVVLRRPGRVVAATAAVVASSVWLAFQLGTEFLPHLDEGTIWVRLNLPPGTSLDKTARVAEVIRGEVRRLAGVRDVASQAGRNDAGTDPFGPNRIEFLITLQPYAEWPRGRTKAMLVEELARLFSEQAPGASYNITQPIIDTVTEAVTGSSADLAILFTGPDLHTLRQLARRALEIVKQIPGAADSSIEQEERQPQLVLEVNRTEMARYGVRVRDLQELIELAIGGRTVSTLYDGDRRFDITVRYIPEARADARAIAGMLVATPSGARVPLGQLATVRVVDGESIIARSENRRMISVRTNIRGRDQGGFAAEVRRRIEQEIPLPDGYAVEWGGQFENMARAKARLSIALPVTVFLIFVLLFFAFRNAQDSLIVMLTVPFSFVGGIGLLALRGIHLSVSAAVGFVSLFGVAVMSGVLMLTEVNRRRRQPGAELRQMLIEACVAQMRPVLMMVVVAMLGMIPAARATGIGSDVQRPLATVVVGGLASTLALTFVGLPALYYLVARWRAKRA